MKINPTVLWGGAVIKYKFGKCEHGNFGFALFFAAIFSGYVSIKVLKIIL